MDESARATIDEIAATFFSIFCFEPGGQPDFEAVRALFIEQGLLIKNSGAEPEINDLSAFIEPRERLVADGQLTRLAEQELSATTQIFGNIAQRFSIYQKSGLLNGQAFDTRGKKTIQLIKTQAGWKMVSVAWDDEREGLSL